MCMFDLQGGCGACRQEPLQRRLKCVRWRPSDGRYQQVEHPPPPPPGVTWLAVGMAIIEMRLSLAPDLTLRQAAHVFQVSTRHGTAL